MDELTRETVKRIGFVNICQSENPTAERANFRMIYEQLAQRKKQDAQIPENIKMLICNTTLLLEGGKGGNNEK